MESVLAFMILYQGIYRHILEQEQMTMRIDSSD